MGERPATWLVTGVSAAGKSTVGQALAERFEPSVHVRGDVFRRMVVHPLEQDLLDHLRLRYAQAAAATDRYHDAGYTVVVQDVIIGPVLADVVASIRSRPLHVVVLVPGRDVVAEREQSRPKTAYAPGRHTLEELDHALRHDTPKLGLWLDTSDQTPDETVDEILRRADESLVS